MAVHFVYRCPYVGPSGRHVAHFPDDTVLAWVRRVWPRLVVPEDREQAYPRLEEILGTSAYDFADYFSHAAEHGLEPPASEAQLREQLEGHLSVQHVLHYRPHALQALTDDDDVMLAYFLFDDHFVRKYPERVAFLLSEGWQLPGGGAGESHYVPAVKPRRLPPAGEGEGTTFIVPLSIDHSYHLESMDYSYRLDGVRLPQLARYLVSVGEDDEMPGELYYTSKRILAASPDLDPHENAFVEALRATPDDGATWMAYSDWLADRGRPSAGITLLRRALEQVAADGVDSGWKHEPSLSRIHAEEHLAQLCIHVLEEKVVRGVRHNWDQWYFFDDLWASAHPALADGLLNYGLRWDALSAWRSKVLEADT